MNYEYMRLDSLRNRSSEQEGLCLSFSVYQSEKLCILSQDMNASMFLLDLLGGSLPSFRGHLYVRNRNIVSPSLRTLQGKGVYVIKSADLLLFETLNLADNIFFHHMPQNRISGDIAFQKMYAQTTELLEEYGLSDLKPTMPLHSLSFHQRLFVCCLRCVVDGARVIVMNAPFFKAHSPAEIRHMQNFFNVLQKNQISIVCISPHWHMIYQGFDRYAILDQGVITKIVSLNRLPDQSPRFPLAADRQIPLADNPSEMVLECKDLPLTLLHRHYSLNIRLRQNEILGILDQHLLLEQLAAHFTSPHRSDNRIFIKGRPWRKYSSPGQALAFLRMGAEDQEIYENLSLCDNITLMLEKPLYNRLGFPNARIQRHLSENILAHLGRSDLWQKYHSRGSLQCPLAATERFYIRLASRLVLKPQVLVLYLPEHRVPVLSQEETSALTDRLHQLGFALILMTANPSLLPPQCRRMQALHDSDPSQEQQTGTHRE